MSLVESNFVLDESPIFTGVYNPDHDWNGWKVPFFSLSEFSKILEFANKDELWISFKEESDKYYVLDNYYKDEGWKELDKIEHNGKVFLATDGWCWNLC